MTTGHEMSARNEASKTARARTAQGFKLGATLLGTSLLIAACGGGGGSTYVAGRYDNGDDYRLPTKDTLFDDEGHGLCSTATVYPLVEPRAAAEKAAMSFIFEALNNEPDPTEDLSNVGDERAIRNETIRRELMQNSLDIMYQSTHPLLFDAENNINSAADLAKAKSDISRALDGAYGASAPSAAYFSVGEGAGLITEDAVYKLERVVVPLTFLDEQGITGYTLQDTLKVTVKKATDENDNVWALIEEKEGTGMKLQNATETVVPESAEFIEEYDINVDLLYTVTLFERGEIEVEEEPTVEPSPSPDEEVTEEEVTEEPSPEPSPTEEEPDPAVSDELLVTPEYVAAVEAYVAANKIDITLNTTTYNYEKATIKAGPTFLEYLMEENKNTGDVTLYYRDGSFVPKRATFATEQELTNKVVIPDETPEVKINLVGDGCPKVGDATFERFWVTGYELN